MNTKEVEQGNKLIAQFMGFEYFPNHYLNGIKGVLKKEGKLSMHLDTSKPFSPEYHSSWDWLHQAFDKFKSMQLKEWDSEFGTGWNHRYSLHLSQISNAIIHKSVLEAFNELVEGVQWYNQNNKP